MARGVQGRSRTTVELLVVVGVAVLAALSTWQHEVADGAWSAATAQEVRWSAAVSEVVRAAYRDAGDGFIELALADSRAERLETLASPEARPERLSARAYATDLAASGRIPGGAPADYRVAGGGYDVGAYVAGLRRQDADLVPRAVEASLAQGGTARWRARALSLAALALVAVFAVVALRSRSGALGPGASTELVPGPWDDPAGAPLASRLAFAAWLAVVLVPLLGAEVGAAASRATADATRLAVVVTRDLTSSVELRSFAIRGGLRADDLELRGRARTRSGDVGQTLVGAAEVTAASLLRSRLADMAQAPTTADGLDAPLAASLATGPVELEATGRAQRGAHERADRLGLAATLSSGASLLAALAATAAALGMSRRRRAPLVDVVAAALLAGAMLAALFAALAVP